MEPFGRYRLLHRIAVGGMAEIFLARSASLDGFDKDLVIKRIRSEYGEEETFASLFIDEAKISISLTHQNIVQVFDFGQHDGSYYLAMEHVYGCNLDQVFSLDSVSGRGIDPALAAFVMKEVCRGLDYAHTKESRHGTPFHIIHRDISPQNIMVTFDGGVKITDFGVAKARGNVSRTEPGVVLGKLAYMSPEQATGASIDSRADIFSCGVVLWEMLVGDRLYGDDPGPELFRRIRHGEVEPPSHRNRNVPEELDRLVVKAVARYPDDRHASARDMGNDLHRFLTRHYPSFSHYDLQSFMDSSRDDLKVISFEDLDEAKEGSGAALEPAASPVTVQLLGGVSAKAPLAPPEFDWRPDLIRDIEEFRRRPSLWRMLKMSEVCAASGQEDAAYAFCWATAAKFAQRGMFAQALLCAKQMLELRSADELRLELAILPQLAGRSNRQLVAHLFHSGGPVEQLILELLADTDPSCGMVGEGTPLLSQLDGRGFAHLAVEAQMRRFEADTRIVDEGDEGHTMYLIARGRVLVYAKNSAAERVYLSSLTAGDFVGENSFFTGAPRSTTVEALYPVDAFEIDHALFDRIMPDSGRANQILLEFYKDRIVDVMLARSPIFGLLPNDDRRALIEKFDLCVFEPGQTVIQEGELSDPIYLVKDGIAEVFSGGDQDSLATLGPGTIFGEVAALRGIPRTATVRAASRLETLCLPGADFHALIAEKPEVKRKLLDVVAKRARENLDRLRLHETPPGSSSR